MTTPLPLEGDTGTPTVRVPALVAAGQRPGWNCTFSYLRGNQKYAYRLRAGRVVHGLNLIFDESQGRMSRSFYPHQLSAARFSVGLILDGTRLRVPGRHYAYAPTEFERFMSWLHSYMVYMLQQDESIAGELPTMSVSIPKYNFFREGVPIGPVLFGDHVGSVIWTPTITFETTRDYLEPATSTQLGSKFLGGLTDLDQEAQFFYPSSPQAETGGNEAPFIFDQGGVGDLIYGAGERGLTAEQQAAAEAGNN